MTATKPSDGLVLQRILSLDDEKDALVALIVSAHNDGDSSSDVVTERVVSILSRLRHLIYEQKQVTPLRIAVVVEEPPNGGAEVRAYRSALSEAARGICQSLAREIGPRIRINTVRCDNINRTTIDPTLHFLASSQADFLTGSTIDLRQDQEGR